MNNKVFNIPNATKQISFFGSKGFSSLKSTKNTLTSDNFDVSYYRCERHVDPAIRFITGCESSKFSVTANSNNIVYDLTDSLIVDSIKQRGNFLSFSHTNNAVIINFVSAICAGSSHSVSIF